MEEIGSESAFGCDKFDQPEDRGKMVSGFLTILDAELLKLYEGVFGPIKLNLKWDDASLATKASGEIALEAQTSRAASI